MISFTQPEWLLELNFFSLLIDRGQILLACITRSWRAVHVCQWELEKRGLCQITVRDVRDTGFLFYFLIFFILRLFPGFLSPLCTSTVTIWCHSAFLLSPSSLLILKSFSLFLLFQGFPIIHFYFVMMQTSQWKFSNGLRSIDKQISIG